MKQDKTHWKKNFDYNYLGSYSLLPNQEPVLTIKEVKKEKVTGTDGRKEDCTVAYFKESVNGENKPMILNKTNCKVIEKIYGTPFIEEWKGKKVKLYVDNKVKAFGEIVDALRIRPQIPTDKITLHPGHEKWENVVSHFKEKGSLSGVLKHYEIEQKHIDQLIKSSK